MTTTDDLIRRGFVQEKDRGELNRYLKALRDFGDVFEPGPGLIEEVSHRLKESADRYRHALRDNATECETASGKLKVLQERTMGPLRILFENDGRVAELDRLFRDVHSGLDSLRDTFDNGRVFDDFEHNLQHIGEQLRQIYQELNG